MPDRYTYKTRLPCGFEENKMGQLVNYALAFAGVRLRDDYGATATIVDASSLTPLTILSRIARSFPVVRLNQAAAMGGLNHDA